MRRLTDITDLLPSSPIAKAVSAAAGGLLMVEPELVFGLAVVVGLNAMMSVLYSFRTDSQTAALVLYWLVMRVLVYIITLTGIIILSNMMSVDVLRRLVFGGAAGWEVAVTMGLGARISPQFAPIYHRVMKSIDEHTPLDATVDDVNTTIDDANKRGDRDA